MFDRAKFESSVYKLSEVADVALATFCLGLAYTTEDKSWELVFFLLSILCLQSALYTEKRERDSQEETVFDNFLTFNVDGIISAGERLFSAREKLKNINYDMTLIPEEFQCAFEGMDGKNIFLNSIEELESLIKNSEIFEVKNSEEGIVSYKLESNTKNGNEASCVNGVVKLPADNESMQQYAKEVLTEAKKMANQRSMLTFNSIKLTREQALIVHQNALRNLPAIKNQVRNSVR